jgi:hypothetical protein
MSAQAWPERAPGRKNMGLAGPRLLPSLSTHLGRIFLKQSDFLQIRLRIY